jgi:hypothetical protein
MPGARGAILLVLTVVLAGCSLVPEGPGPKSVSGPTDGYTPTKAYLKVFVKTEDGNVTLADFDPRDWYVAKIADQIDRKQLTYLWAKGQAREILHEVVVEEVLEPSDLATLRFASMSPTPQQRALFDLEYQDILRRAGADLNDNRPPTMDLPLVG